MYGIYTNLGGILMVNVTIYIYISYMDPMGKNLKIRSGIPSFWTNPYGPDTKTCQSQWCQRVHMCSRFVAGKVLGAPDQDGRFGAQLQHFLCTTADGNGCFSTKTNDAVKLESCCRVIVVS